MYIYIKKEGHYISIKGTIHKEDTKTPSILTPNHRAPNLIKQTLMAEKVRDILIQ